MEEDGDVGNCGFGLELSSTKGSRGFLYSCSLLALTFSHPAQVVTTPLLLCFKTFFFFFVFNYRGSYIPSSWMVQVVDQTCYLTKLQNTDTGPTRLSADPKTPGAWHWGTIS